MYIRKNYLDQLKKFKDSDFIKVITGVRRSGKSVLLMQYQDYLISEGISPENIIYINLEAFEFLNVKDEVKLSELLLNMIKNKSQKYYLLIDEIQWVDGWQKVINGLRVSFNCDIVITGSNAKLLSGELATLLSGRYVEIVVFPFSFKEFLESKHIAIESRKVDLMYKEYERYGGFPSVVYSDETIKTTILSGIHDSIILNDIADRGLIRDTFSLKRVVSFLADNVGQMINSNKIANILKSEKLSISNHTVNRYLELLQDAFLFYEAKSYDIRGKKYLKQNSKYFMIDNGLRNEAVSFQGGNFGNRLENLVYIELLRRGYEVSIARIDDKEIDFIARKPDITIYYQVTHQIPSNTHETDNLLLLKDNYQKVLITGRYEDVSDIDGIRVVYVVDWLLETDSFNLS